MIVLSSGVSCAPGPVHVARCILLVASIYYAARRQRHAACCQSDPAPCSVHRASHAPHGARAARCTRAVNRRQHSEGCRWTSGPWNGCARHALPCKRRRAAVPARSPGERRMFVTVATARTAPRLGWVKRGGLPEPRYPTAARYPGAAARHPTAARKYHSGTVITQRHGIPLERHGIPWDGFDSSCRIPRPNIRRRTRQHVQRTWQGTCHGRPCSCSGCTNHQCGWAPRRRSGERCACGGELHGCR
jgi:hypothetical protein